MKYFIWFGEIHCGLYMSQKWYGIAVTMNSNTLAGSAALVGGWLSPSASVVFLHCALASCGAVYCNRSCLWICDSGRAGGGVRTLLQPAREQCLRLSERFFIKKCYLLMMQSCTVPSVYIFHRVRNRNTLSRRLPSVSLCCNPSRQRILKCSKCEQPSGRSVSSLTAAVDTAAS